MMNAQPILDSSVLYPRPPQTREVPRENADNFRSLLDASLSPDRVKTSGSPLNPAPAGYLNNNILQAAFFQDQPAAPIPRKELAAAYAQQSVPEQSSSPSPLKEPAAAYTRQSISPKAPVPMSSWQKYKDDQLLRNPGGDHYYLEEKRVSKDPDDRKSFLSRVGKNLSDFFGNVKNFFGNLLMGSKIRYRDENNEIKEATTRGLIGTCVDFFKDLGSALTFGLWHPDDEKGPQGFTERLTYSGSKLMKAVLGDLVEGIPQSVNHMAKNVVLAGWNLVQVVPDATIGNFDAGRKLTTTIFDNGQVMIEYLTDVIPSGEAWFRVHAASLSGLKVPVLYNLEMPENSNGDTRWNYVRNTPFRKTIETIGTLLADIAVIGLLGQTCVSTNQSGEKQKLLNSLIR